MSNFHPFQLLKLIRDNEMNVQKLRGLAFKGRTLENYQYRRFLDGLKSLELVDVSQDGEIVPTVKLSLLLESLDISLTQLEHFSEDSAIHSPVFGLPSKEFEKVDIFMVMPFLAELKPVYDDHIRSVAENLGVSIVRGDDFFTTGPIISDIWNAINSCKLVIADCTSRNPNVFYEIGVAHAIGKQVLLISQNRDDIPFDVRHIRHIIYEYTPRGMTKFENELRFLIEGMKSGQLLTPRKWLSEQ